MRLSRRAALAGVAATSLPTRVKAADSVLRVGMTIADIPLTTGQPSQGGEGQRLSVTRCTTR